LRQCYPDTPFVGLEPAVKPAALTTKSGTIAVLATARALEGELFLHTSAQFADSVNILKAVGEGFVEIVERGEECSAEAETAVRGVIEPLIEKGADKIVLGCTHYPFLRPTMERVIGDRDVEVIDSGRAVCRRVAQLLDEYDLRAEQGSEPLYEFMTLGDDDYFDRMIYRAYGCIGEEEAEDDEQTDN
jgi:glutamate racemase